VVIEGVNKNSVQHGRRQKSFQGGTTSTFCLYFSGCRRYNANWRLQNALPFYNTKKMPRITARVTKMRFFGSNSQAYYDNTTGYLHISKTGNFSK